MVIGGAVALLLMALTPSADEPQHLRTVPAPQISAH
jgi:hypothetical protein